MSIIDYCRPQSKAALLLGERVLWIENNPRASYIRQCVLSFPPWVDRRALRALWHKCRLLEHTYGVPYELGHIVPLNHPYVSGLSVPWNLRPQTARSNAAQGNSFFPDQRDFFEIPYFLMKRQLELFA